MKNKPAARMLFLFLLALPVFLPAAAPAQTVSFAAGKTFTTGIGPKSIAVGDFNRDGIPDLAVPLGGESKVAIHLGSVGGNFGPATKFPAGTQPIGIVAADFNGDGKLDLAVANHASHTGVISVLLGAGDGTFGSATSFSAGDFPRALAVGDFNRDGIPDLAVVNDTGEDVSILLGDGDGAFSGPTHFSVGPNGSLPISVAVGDLNGDGVLDLVVANNFGSSVAILLGAVDGSFTLKVQPNTNLTLPQPTAAAIGDFNRDGIPDLAIANSGNRVTIRLGVGDGTFTKPTLQNFTVGTNPVFVVAADLNGDGILDLAAADFGGGRVSVLTGVGDGTFAAVKNFSVKSGPRAIAVADLDGDGRPDLAVPNDTAGNVSVLLNATGFAPAGAFAAHSDFGLTDDTLLSPATGPVSVATGDFDGDGMLDLAVANNTSGNVSILIGDGAGAFTAGTPISAGSGPSSVAVGDFNRDGKLDFAVANNAANNVSVFLGDGLGGFSAASGSPIAAGSGPSSIAVGDLNGDGRLDLAVANSGSDNVTILLGVGNGTFTAATPVPAGSGPSSLAAGDFDRDGVLDLAVANSGDDNVTILLGDGAGAFTEPTGSPFAAGTGPLSVAAGDFDGDGVLDLAVANNGSGNVSVLLGVGDGTFGAAVNFGAGAAPSSVVLADLDRDGKLDLAVANSGDDDVTILFGDGAGAFPATLATIFGSPFDVGLNPRALAAGDFDGDGRPDLAAANQDSDNVSILLNTAPPPTVLAPQSGDVWTLGSTQTIRWVFAGGGDFVNVQLSRNGGATFTTILKKTPNDGSQAFRVSGAAAATAQIRVCTPKPITCAPVSGNFSITP